MINTMKVSKNQENLIQCALAAMELYKQALSPQMSLFPAPEPKKEENHDMAKKQAIKLPAATLDDIRQTAKDALDLKAKEIIYKTVVPDTYTAWFHNRGFVCFFAQGMPSFDVQGTFIKQQVLATLCRSIEKRDDGLTQRTRESVDVDKMDEL